MKYPNLREEKKLWRKGYKRVAGLDEAGRGPLAGPVVASATIIKISNFKFQIPKPLKEVKDSKQLTPKKREEFYKILTKGAPSKIGRVVGGWRPQIEWGIGRVSEKVIDKINILEATKLAMVKAVKKLKRKPDFLILDGNFILPAKALAKAGINKSITQKSIVKADEKVFSCALASILAKVTRDRIMQRYHRKFPRYGFDKHKGYPTKFHRKMLKKYGHSIIHRLTFAPVKKMI